MPAFRFLGWRRVKVAGESMSPTFHDGDVLVVKWFEEVKSELPLASVVVIERDEMPGVYFIKRIQKAHSGAYWVEGDNREPDVEKRMNDSRTWGYIPAHEIRGRVLIRLKKVNARKLQR